MKPQLLGDYIETGIQCPTSPSELVTMAIDDLELCEKDPSIRINMGEWVAISDYYEPDSDICYACLAGSVMVKTLEINRDFLRSIRQSMSTPGKMKDEQWEGAFLALNQLRQNRIFRSTSGFRVRENILFINGHPKFIRVHPESESYMWDIEVPHYDIDPDKFKASMRQIAAWYKEWEDAQVSVD